MVYDFLIEECKLIPSLWNKFGKGLISHTTDVDFWEELGEQLDCFRICNECGRPMIEGYVIDGRDTYCSEECMHKHCSDEEFYELYDDGNGDTYWTSWYENSKVYKNKKQ